jgi:hypothetical protein
MRGLITRGETGQASSIEWDLTGYESLRKHQLSATLDPGSTAGTLDVSIKSPGGGYVSIGSINLLTGAGVVVFEAYCQGILLTPSSLTGTYSAYYVCGNEVTNV